MKMCVSFGLYFPFLLASVLFPVTWLATINIGNKSCICIAGIHGGMHSISFARKISTPAYETAIIQAAYMRAYHKSLKKQDWDCLQKQRSRKSTGGFTAWLRRARNKANVNEERSPKACSRARTWCSVCARTRTCVCTAANSSAQCVPVGPKGLYTQNFTRT